MNEPNDSSILRDKCRGLSIQDIHLQYRLDESERISPHYDLPYNHLQTDRELLLQHICTIYDPKQPWHTSTLYSLRSFKPTSTFNRLNLCCFSTVFSSIDELRLNFILETHFSSWSVSSCFTNLHMILNNIFYSFLIPAVINTPSSSTSVMEDGRVLFLHSLLFESVL